MKQTFNVTIGHRYKLLIAGILLASFADIATAQFVSPIAAERGVTPAVCRLTNLSCGANWDAPVDPSLPTYVITHGYNPLPNLFRLTTPQAYAVKIRECYGANVNVLAYHWDSRGQHTRNRNTENASRAGRTLAQQLLARGVDPANTTMIGHSMGTIVITKAARCMFHQTGSRTKKLTMLDAPKRRLSLLIDELQATCIATQVENYWAGGLSGLGAPVCHPQVKNIQAPFRRPKRGRRGLRGWFSPAKNNHIDILLWYYEMYL